MLRSILAAAVLAFAPAAFAQSSLLHLGTAPTLAPGPFTSRGLLTLGNAAFSPVTKPGAATVALASPPAAGNLSAGVYSYEITFTTATGETEAGTVSSNVTVAVPGTNGKVQLTAIPVSTDARVVGRSIYRTVHDGSTYKLVATISDNTTATYLDNIADASLGATVPSVQSTAGVLTSGVTGTNTAFNANTGAAITGKLWNWQNNSVDKAWINYLGTFVSVQGFASSLNGGANYVILGHNGSGIGYTNPNNATNVILSGAADGGSAVAHAIGSSATYSTAGAKIVSVTNNGTEKAYIDKDGKASFGGGSTNKAVCWKTGGVLGYCSTVVDSSGACTCN